MTAHTNGSPMTTTTTRHLAGGVTATVVTVNDLDGTTTAIQLTTPDEPLSVGDALNAADELWNLAGALVPGVTA